MGPWTMQRRGDGVVEITWAEGNRWWADPQASGALAEFVGQILADGVRRVEAQAPVTEVDLRRTLQRAGLRPEGVARGLAVGASGQPVDVTRLARLAQDPWPGSGQAFLAMLNATLPTKRVIAQGVIRNARDDVLMCGLTYKKEWDLPGGVVDPDESPAAALTREVGEELGLDLPVRELLAINWLPPYRQWDDALLLVFDLGVQPDVLDRVRLQPTEIASLQWCDAALVRDHAAPYVARLVGQLWQTGFSPVEPATHEHALAERYLEDGRPRGS